MRTRPLVVASIPIRSPRDLDLVDGARDADLVELRLDYLGNPFSIAPEDLAGLGGRIIATLRDPSEGGARPLDPKAKEAYLRKLARLGILYDVEISFVERTGTPFQGKIVSAHYLEKLPEREDLLARIRPYLGRAFAVKIALARLRGYREILAALLDLEREDLAFMTIGGDPLERVALALMGSKLVYGHAGEPTAPGQAGYREIKRILDAAFNTV